MIKLGRKRWRYGLVLLSLLITTTFVACRQFSSEVNSVATNINNTNNATEIISKESGVLTIWWYKGYVKAEKTYLEKIVSDWEKENSKKIQLVFFDQEVTLNEAIIKGVASGATPDITITSRLSEAPLAWQGKLKDVSAIIKPIESSFPDSVLQSSSLYNNVTKKTSYYAVPIYQEGVYLHYWKDLLAQLGYKDSDIPQDWDGFWQFWQTVHQQLQSQQPEIFGIGFATSPISVDTFLFFEYLLEAYNIRMLDSEGQLLVNRPETRQGIIDVLKWWTQFYQKDYISPSALVWKGPDNNFSFHNRIIAMTPNSTLSIPAARVKEPDVYFQQLATIPYPKKPNGEPMTYLTKVRQVVVFAERNFDDAQSFLSYLIRPDIIGSYIEASGGRFFPVNKNNWDDPFWNNPDDPHLSVVRKIFTESLTRSHYFSDNPAYVELLNDNIWGQALHQIIVDGASPEQAADWAVAQIEETFEQWQ